MKKSILFLLLGVLLGIGGEFAIPKEYRPVVGAGCVKDDSGMVFMSQMLIYDPNNKDYPYPAPYGGYGIPFVPSYRYLYALFSHELIVVSQEQCNELIRKYNERNK